MDFHKLARTTSRPPPKAPPLARELGVARPPSGSAPVGSTMAPMFGDASTSPEQEALIAELRTQLRSR